MSKPVPERVKTMTYDGDNGYEVLQWMGDAVLEYIGSTKGLAFRTKDGSMLARPGDLIINDNGHISVRKGDG